MSSLKRIKNVTVVMEWIPEMDNLKLEDNKVTLTKSQEDELRAAFHMFDTVADADGDGKVEVGGDNVLSMREAKEVLRAVDVDDEEEIDGVPMIEKLTLTLTLIGGDRWCTYD